MFSTHVIPAISNGLVLRLSDETEKTGQKVSKKHKAD